MIVADRFGAGWAYILGPLIGGAAGALLYNKFLAPPRNQARRRPPRSRARRERPD
jgi:hypothetical protein